MLDMSFSGAAKIDDTTAEERDDIAGAPRSLYLFAEALVTVIRAVHLSDWIAFVDTTSSGKGMSSEGNEQINPGSCMVSSRSNGCTTKPKDAVSYSIPQDASPFCSRCIGV